MFKKLVSILLTVTMLTGIVCTTGCGEKKDKEVTLKWMTTTVGQEDEAKVLEVVNKRLETLLPGTKLEFVELDSTKFTQQMAAGEAYDIVWTGYRFDMKEEVKQGSYLALNGLITKEDTPNLYQEWQEYADDYATGMVDDKLYAIPNQQPLITETPHLIIPEPLMQYFDVEAFTKATYASRTTTREVYEVIDDYLEKVWSANAVDTDIVSDSIDIRTLYESICMRGFESVGNNLVYYNSADKLELMNKFETEEYKLFLEYAAKWYKAGYISADILVDTGTSAARVAPLAAHGNGTFYGADEKGVRPNYDNDGNIDKYYVNVEPADYSHTVQGTRALGAEQTYLAIPYTCKNPEKVIKFLDLLRSPIGTEGNDLLNLIVYGFEKNSEEAKEYGTYHYTLEGEDLAVGNGYTIQPAASNLYGKPHWEVANVFLTYRTPNILEGQKDHAKKYDTEVVSNSPKTILYGFTADVDDYATEVGNVKSVVEEYEKRLYAGVEGDNYLKLQSEFISKMKTAGMDKIYEAINKQANDFLNK